MRENYFKMHWKKIPDIHFLVGKLVIVADLWVTNYHKGYPTPMKAHLILLEPPP
jgi:hypothetical protein